MVVFWGKVVEFGGRGKLVLLGCLGWILLVKKGGVLRVFGLFVFVINELLLACLHGRSDVSLILD